MPDELAIVPLNLLVEFLSECADLRDFESLLRVVGRRVRWIIDFERFSLCLLRGSKRERVYWTVAQSEDGLHEIAASDVSGAHAELIDRAMQGTFDSDRPTTHALCAPLLLDDVVFGAICFSFARGQYAYRDTRFVYHLAQCLGSTIIRLELAQEAAAESRRKDEFLARLGHELRNPLAPILTAVQLLKADAPGAAPSQEVAIIERQAWHLQRLIDDLIEVSRSKRGPIALHRAPAEIAPIITRAVELSSPLLDRYAHHLDIRAPATGLAVDADVGRLAQVLANLLNNAARYTDAGGRITVAARRDRNDVVVDVSDDGIGIGPETLPRVFDEFVRGTRATARAQGGLGLGLSIVRTLTELHGGSVSAASAGRGSGATFTVRLPALPVDAVPLAARAADAPAIAVTERPQRILLVDDNEDAAEMMARILTEAGHEVAVAHDGPQALLRVVQFRPTVAILDIGLPVMDGHELAAKLRSLLLAEVPYLIALTGYGEEGDRLRSAAAGFAHHLVKPISADVLLESIGLASAHAGPRAPSGSGPATCVAQSEEL